MADPSEKENAERLSHGVVYLANALSRIADSFETLVKRGEAKPEDIAKQATEMIEQIFSATGLNKLLTPAQTRSEPTIKSARIVERDSDAA